MNEALAQPSHNPSATLAQPSRNPRTTLAQPRTLYPAKTERSGMSGTSEASAANEATREAIKLILKFKYKEILRFFILD